ncbi:hypothetical protein A3C77_00025 [Candidatus Giovannonibacteria bacterium RIFCSPHIGHO2_02_FULL_45_13]|nr:MAG: hypothetical protein A3C77_00025 [Candidatus Giovannonibacteria bacterium RIFCSPHIGHO2_02_FULL_45_13]
MSRPLSTISILLSISLFLFPFEKVSAAITYSRSPSGASIAGPVTFNVSLDSFDDSGCVAPHNNFWEIIVYDYYGVAGGGSAISSYAPASTLSIKATIALPVGDIYSVEIGCSIDGVEKEQGVASGALLENSGGEVLIFTVVPPPPGSTGGVAGPTQYRPEVNILSPAAGSVFGKSVEIKYLAKDQNDTMGGASLERFGLGPNPVSLYYADDIDIFPGKSVVEEDKKLIAKDLIREGAFLWDTKDVPEGFLYRIVANAIDKYGDIGESVSPLFSIDHTAPVFTVKADPQISKGENVKIIVTSSKDLVRPPKVIVTQRGFRPVEIDMRRSDLLRRSDLQTFEGTYYVSTGYDGPALISVSGEDLVGNEGNVISSGGSFSVGVEPPPKPIIVSPLDKDITTSQVVNIKGRAREDTEVVVMVNGKDEYKTRPDKDGNFILDGVKLYSDFNKGVNFIGISARDATGNTSEAVSLTVKFNLTPELAILSPQKGAMLTGTTTIRISASDKNNDPLKFAYELSADGGATWSVLSENTSRKQVVWRTTDFSDGQYQIRVTASDGTTKTEIVSETFLVKNNLPAISFDGGEKAVSNKTDIAIPGKVLGSEGAIDSVEYSLDGGKTWSATIASDGAFNSASESFTFNQAGLKEGLYKILFRARDARGLYGRSTKIVIVDFGPPPAPAVHLETEFPSEVLSDLDDEDASTAGVQFALKGASEPQSRVSAVIDGKTFSASANSEGVFKISGITLRNHGKNEITLFATDLAENKSPETKTSFIYNNPPALKFLAPREGKGLNHKTIVRWEVADPDGDKIESLILSYRRGSGDFRALLKSPTAAKFSWDVSNFLEGSDYELKLEAADGVSASVTARQFYIDNTPPEVTLDPLSKTAFNKSFTLALRGRAKDNFSGVEFVEYSIDGEHWFKALIADGFLQKSASWLARHPFVLEDGDYDLRVRAVDAAGNLSGEAVQKITVDTTPPRIGSFTLSKGAIMLLPEGDEFKILVGAKLVFRTSLETDTVKAEIKDLPLTPSQGRSKNNTLPLGEGKGGVTLLTKNKSTGLWETELVFDELGKFDLLISAEDALGNKTANKKIGEAEIIRRGKTAPGASINVFVKNSEDQSFQMWQAEAYETKNPVVSNERGEYELLLPEGTYQILVKKTGFERLRTSEFELISPRFVNFDFALKPRTGLRGAIEDLLEKLNFEL